VAAEHCAIDIAAAPERVWQVIVDIESWPQWTKSVTDVKRLDSGPLQVGSRARLKQPALPPLTWKVTELQQGAQFSWVCRLPGVTTTWTGPLAGLVAALNRTRTHRLLETEANGAKARSERALPAAMLQLPLRRTMPRLTWPLASADTSGTPQVAPTPGTPS
jgi:uncharacterized membrane protein